VRVVVLVSGRGSNLQALIDTVHGNEVEIVGVASDRAGAPALDRAASAAIPTAVFLRDDYEDRTARDLAMGDWAVARGAELVVLAGYMALLTPAFVTRFPDRIVNVHPSLLPAFAGIHAIEQAIDHGVKVVGVTVHLVDEGVDTGAILLQRAIPMPDAPDPAAVHAALQPLEHELLPAAVRLLAAGRVHRDAADPRRVVITPPGAGD
jgi:phosphoribosylglycinamide formyltransferase-1